MFEDIMATQVPVEADDEGHEKQRHGTVGFPCGVYYSDPTYAAVPWHWHDELEFIHVVHGTLVYAVGSERYRLSEGDSAFANSGVPHAEFAWRGTPALERGLVFSVRLVCDQSSDLWRRYLGPLVTDTQATGCALRADGPAWQAEASRLVLEAHEAAEAGEQFFEETVRDLLTRACLLVWKGLGVREGVAGEGGDRATERVKRMIDYISEHPSGSFSVSDIAAVAGVSARECQREFKDALGMSPMEYVAQQRLALAARMVAETTEPLASIASICGFSSQSYFSRAFKASFGHSPSEHRRMAAEPLETRR